MSGRLSRTEADLLREVVSRRSPTSLPLLDALADRRLSEDEREELRHIVMDDFVERGLRDDDEPNEGRRSGDRHQSPL